MDVTVPNGLLFLLCDLLGGD